jgi:hypothetical protein
LLTRGKKKKDGTASSDKGKGKDMGIEYNIGNSGKRKWEDTVHV